MRATFANIRLRNHIVPGREGSVTRLMPEGLDMPIFDAAMAYQQRGVPLCVLAGRNYGCGSSRDTAAKGVALLGVKAVIAESFERIHRTNLVGMGVLPLTFQAGEGVERLRLDGTEVFDLPELGRELCVRGVIMCRIRRSDGNSDSIRLNVELHTSEELNYWQNGGILPAVWRDFMQAVAT